ncbi:hypothetical protein CWO91_30295 [Bradyrhizobium genosp. SA-3]|uniref:endo-1,3-alpha-glucanase family glycosylhydrolase n=1 Tax=Bradyrhizobium genosp. SA-3 TaxID=508868 RepID=UPI0010294277|nr:hypothetical protein CWO91_30295 [Bradyrhizobium genosp. SA-3]
MGANAPLGDRSSRESKSSRNRDLSSPSHELSLLTPRITFSSETSDTYVARIVLQQAPDIDGFFSFGAGGPYNEMARSIREISPLMHKNGKLFMAGIAPFYRGLGNNFRVFESNGFEGMQKRWLAAIEADADWVELVTWNDWSEATYLKPFGRPQESIWKHPAWRSLPDHGAFLQASRFYLDWFKTGAPPPIQRDRIFYFYQLHPRSAEGTRDFSSLDRGRPKFWEQLTDQFHLATFLTSPAHLSVRIGDHSHSLNLPAGAQLVSVPMSLGRVVLRVERGDKLLGEAELPFPIRSDAGTENFNYFTGELALDAWRSAP